MCNCTIYRLVTQEKANQSEAEKPRACPFFSWHAGIPPKCTVLRKPIQVIGSYFIIHVYIETAYDLLPCI